MPLRDGTGPRGRGPRTGRGLGPCPASSSGLADENKRLKEEIKKLKAQIKK